LFFSGNGIDYCNAVFEEIFNESGYGIFVYIRDSENQNQDIFERNKYKNKDSEI